MGMKEKKKKRKIQNGRLKKTEFFKTANSQNVFAKLSWIGPWVSIFLWKSAIFHSSKLPFDAKIAEKNLKSYLLFSW